VRVFPAYDVDRVSDFLYPEKDVATVSMAFKYVLLKIRELTRMLAEGWLGYSEQRKGLQRLPVPNFPWVTASSNIVWT
jgi:hypothetical protein